MSTNIINSPLFLNVVIRSYMHLSQGQQKPHSVYTLHGK